MTHEEFNMGMYSSLTLEWVAPSLSIPLSSHQLAKVTNIHKVIISTASNIVTPMNLQNWPSMESPDHLPSEIRMHTESMSRTRD